MLISVAFFIARQFPFLIFWPTANKREPKSVVRACVCVLHFLFLFFLLCCGTRKMGGLCLHWCRTWEMIKKNFFFTLYGTIVAIALSSHCHRRSILFIAGHGARIKMYSLSHKLIPHVQGTWFYCFYQVWLGQGSTCSSFYWVFLGPIGLDGYFLRVGTNAGLVFGG